MKNTTKYLGLFVALAMPLSMFAQDDPQEDLNALIGIRLDAAEIKLEEMGYQLAYNGLFKKEEIWFHEAANTCVEITHDSKRNDQTILTVGKSASSKCPTSGLAPTNSEANSLTEDPLGDPDGEGAGSDEDDGGW